MHDPDSQSVPALQLFIIRSVFIALPDVVCVTPSGGKMVA